MPIDAAKFNALLDDEEVSGARASALNAPSLAPQDMGRAQKYARAGGLPVLAVANDLEFHDRKAALDEVEDTARQSPAMAQWLSRPENVAVSKGELPLLSKLAMAIAYPLYSEDAVSTFTRAQGRALRNSAEAAAAGVHQSVADFIAGAFKYDSYGNPIAVFDDAEGGIQKQIYGAAVEQGEKAREIGWGARSRLAIDAAPYQDNPLARTLLGVTQSVPIMVAGVGATLVGGPAAGFAAMLAGTGGQQYSAARSEGADGQDAALSGITHGVLEATMDTLTIGIARFGYAPFRKALEKQFGEKAVVKLLDKATATAARRVTLAAAQGAATEAPTTVAQMASDEAILDKDYSLQDYVRGIGDSVLQGGAMSGGMYAAMRPLRAAAERDKARVESAYLDNVIGSSLASKTREADPLAYEALLQGSNPEATVYVQQDALAALYQGEADARAAVADLTGDATAWDEATATGGEVAIPLSKYATHLAEQHATLGPKARMEPGAEVHADTHLPTPDEIKADLDKFFAEAQKDSERGAGAEGEVYDAFYGQVLPHYGDVGAAQVAATMQAFYRTMAAKVGTDPLTLFNRFRINIGGPEQLARGKRRDVDIGIDPVIDAALNGREFKDGEIYGRGMIDAIIKSGGIRPDSMGAGDLVASGARRPGFFNEQGMTVEAMAESLADGGWRGAFTQLDEFGRPDYRELLDLVRQELMGSPVYATDHDMRTQVSIDKREAFNRDVSMVQAAFREHAQRTGVDPATLTRAEQRRIAEGAFGELEQPAYHGTHARGIERFTLQKIGTGEGAQAFGWGLYFAGQKEIAEHYRDKLSGLRGMDEYNAVVDAFIESEPDADYSDAAIAVKSAMSVLADDGRVSAASTIAEIRRASGEPRPKAEEIASRAATFVASSGWKPPAGMLYRVDVPEDSDLLDYDKPMSQNPPAVRDRAKRVWDAMPEWWQNEVLERTNAEFDDLTGSEFYQVIGKFADEGGMPGEFAHPDAFDRSVDGKEAASHALFVAGIPGLRYVDGGNRSPDRTDAQLVAALEKYPDDREAALNMAMRGVYNTPKEKAKIREAYAARMKKLEKRHNYVIWDESAISEPEALYQSAADPRLEGTKVVGKDGKPLVVYHGTDAVIDGAMRVPAFFAVSREMAQWYGSNLQEAYLALRNPLDVRWSDSESLRIAREAGVSEAEIASYEDSAAPTYDPRVVAALQAAGYDGLITSDSMDGALSVEEGTVYVALDPAQIVPADAALYQSAEGMAQQTVPTFFSQLITSIESAKQERAPGAQWLGWLSNLPGITREELEFYDVPGWLSGQKSVTKQALLDYLRANELTIEEDVKGDIPKPPELNDLPFKAVEVDGVWNVRHPDGSLAYRVPPWDEEDGRLSPKDAAEISAYEMSVGYLRTQGVSLPSLGDRFLVSRVTAQDVEDFGLDDESVGKWAVFDRTAAGDPDDYMGAESDGSYAEAMVLGANMLADMDADTVPADLTAVARPAPYANMTLPGGTGYKVMLLKLPASQQAPESARDAMIRERVEMLRGLAADARAEGDDAAAALQDEAIANLLARNPQTTATKAREDFTDGHWQEPNVVAHVRFDERTDADGKRVLFVQELQSDWHQKGRKQGYQGVLNAQYPARDAMAADVGWQLRPATDADAARFGLPNPNDFTHVTYQDGSVSLYGTPDVEEALQKEWRSQQTMRFYQGKGSMPDAEWDALVAMMPALERDDSSGSAVPDAPFKTTWPELVMKRMLRYAAENGFDRVAWPTPEQVPQIEQWGITLADIKSQPTEAKRFGAILDRYATEVPRIAKRLAKQMGGRLVESDLRMAKPTGAYQSFRDSVEGRMEEQVGSAYTRDLLARVTDQLVPDIEAAPVEAVQSAVDEVLYGIANEDGFPEIAEMMRAAAAGLTSKESAGLNPAIEITPTMREAILGGLPLFQRQGGKKGPRGQVLGRDGESIVRQAPDAEGVREFNITLFEGKDLSTVLHESAHAFLEIFSDLAEDAQASDQLRKDYAAALKWLGVTDRSQIGREQHEQFARGFEAYAREGKAPSRSLRRAFAQFKTFLLRIYQVATQLDVRLTDEVRGVFDRMLASEAEIAEATQAQALSPLLTDFVALGWTPEQAEAYQVAVAEAQADAEHRLAAELLRAHQRADLAWWREERRRVRAEVEAETRALPVYRALRWLRNGKLPDGTDVPRAFKLSKADLLDDYGQSFLKRLRGTYSVEGGVRADEAAALLGYSSGRELVDALVNAPPLREVVDADTDRIMAERYPDPMTDGSLADRAMHAVHSGKAADLMLLEVQALERGQRRGSTQMAIMREAVSRILSSKVARKVTPQSYRAAEAKAGREALEAAAKGDMATALDARRRQLLNHLLFAEATRIRTEVEKAHRYLAKFTKTKARAKLGKARGDYLEQIDGLLERFDFRALSGKASDRRARLRDWIQSKAADGVMVDLPEQLVDDAFAVPFRDLTVEQVRQLRDAVKHIHHLATLKGKLLLKGEVLDREAIDNEVAGSVRENSVALPDVAGEPSRGAWWAEQWAWARATMGAATDMARRLDGYKDLGPVWRHTVGVIRDAINNQVNPQLERAAKTVADLYLTHFTKAELRQFAQARKVAGVQGLWSKDRILSLALNWGNEGNRQAILTQARQRLSPEEVGLLLQTLSARDWAFVQAVWGAIDTYWPAVAESQRRRKGLAPEKVAASPFGVVTADGQTLTIAGGYYPLKYEGGTRKMREEADEFYDAIRTGRFAKASTKDGHTIERVGSGGRSVRLDLGVIDSHLRDVIRDLYLGDAVNYTHQVLHGAEFARAVEETGHVETIKGLDVWLRDVATGEIGIRDVGQKTARFIRQNFTAAQLTWKFVSAALQITGLLQSSVVLGKAPMLAGLQRYVRRPLAMTRYATAASPFMASRVKAHVEAVQEVMDARAGRIKQAHSAMIRYGYWMIGRVQQVVDVSTWLAAEAKGLEDFGGDIEKARLYADDVVSRAQGSGEFMDKTALQRGTFGDNVRQSEWIRASTMLQGYMITKHNAIIGRTAKAAQAMDGISGRSVWEGMKWAGDMANLLVIESIIVAIIRGSLPGDEDDDGAADDWLAFMASEAGGAFFGGIAGLGGLVSELRGYDAKGVVATAYSDFGALLEQTQQGKLDKALVKASVRVAGDATGIPSGQINKTIDAIAAEQDGKDVSILDYLRGPPKK